VPPIRPEYNHGSEANDVADNNSANVETNIARTDMVDPSEFSRKNSGSAGIVPALIDGYAFHNQTGTSLIFQQDSARKQSKNMNYDW